MRVHRQGKAQNAQRKPQRREHAVAPRCDVHQHRGKRIRRRVDKAAAPRAEVHPQPDAQRRRNGERAAALKGEQQHRQHREDATRRKAVRGFERGRGHQHAEQDEKRRVGVVLLFLVAGRQKRAAAHRAERAQQQRHQAVCRLAHAVAQDVDELDGEHHPRAQQRQKRPLFVEFQIEKRVVRREDQNSRGEGPKCVRKRQKQHSARRRADQRAHPPQSCARCADHAERERRVAAEHLRTRQRERERKAQHAVDDLSGPFLAFEQFDHLHSLSPPCASIYCVGDYCKRAERKSLSGNTRAKKRTGSFKTVGPFFHFTAYLTIISASRAFFAIMSCSSRVEENFFSSRR